MALPAGFRFWPTSEELISCYLLKKVKGEELPWNGMIESDIYGENAPWEIFGDLPDQEEEKVYVFTRLKKVSKNRVGRTAGCGTWYESYCEKIYHNRSKRVIGLKKLFCFKVKEGTRMKKTKWLMHEFSLSGEQEQTTHLVLCVIQKRGTEARIGVKRSFQDHSFTDQDPTTGPSAETAFPETPEIWVNTDMLPPEDGTRQGKRMRCNVESDGPEATEMPPERSYRCMTTDSATEFTPSESTIDNGEDREVSSTQATELETQGGWLPNCDASDLDFYASYGYLPPLPSPKGGDRRLGQWMESFFDDVWI